MKILVIGGHLTPALSLLTYLQSTDHQAVFVGREYASLHTGAPAYESLEVSKLGYRFIPYQSPKLDRYRLFSSLISAPQFLPALARAFTIIRAIEPDLIVGFGGYLQIPFIYAAWRLHIPSVIHEQTAVAGLSNQLAAHFASAVAISYPSSRRYFPRSKTTLIGNLIRPEIFLSHAPPPPWAPQAPSKPILFVTGGNQGSVTINRVVASLYPTLIKDYFLIHQTGQSAEGVGTGSPQSCFDAQSALSPRDQTQLVIKPWFSALEISWIYHHVFIAVTRCGANTISELIACTVPCLLLPLPHTHLAEQQTHAQLIADAGGGLYLKMNTVTPTTFTQALQNLAHQYPHYVQGMHSLKPYISQSATKAFVTVLQQVVKQHS